MHINEKNSFTRKCANIKKNLKAGHLTFCMLPFLA